MDLGTAIEKTMEENNIRTEEDVMKINFEYLMKRAMILFLNSNNKVYKTGKNKGKFNYKK